MVVVEGVARSLDPKLDIWAAAEPVVREWIERHLGPLGSLETAAEGMTEIGQVFGHLPELLTRAASLTAQLDLITRNGLVLAPETVAEIGRAEARRNRGSTVALWVIVGLLAWLALLGMLGAVPADRWLGVVGLGLAFLLVTSGLIASTAHLGRPERAWRAFSQWRTSWLSREAVFSAVLGAMTFITREGDAPFSPQEILLASDLGELCALALDNERLYRQARKLREAANVANDAKSIFLGNMSHELMTPLNAIGGYVALIEMGLRGPVSAEQLVDFARIRHNQAHLLTLISEMLTFVRSESGRMEYRLGEVPAYEALSEVAEMLRDAVDERQFKLVESPDNVDAVMWADSNRVRQILLNLVTNAVKYASSQDGQITLSVSQTSGDVAIHVVDTGPGIPHEKLNAIFDPFVQLASGLSDRRGGVGLGLAISRDLARAMNGDLTVESTVGVGSRFTLRLPRAPRINHTKG
jgi:signal transduction histidine kinase